MEEDKKEMNNSGDVDEYLKNFASPSEAAAGAKAEPITEPTIMLNGHEIKCPQQYSISRAGGITKSEVVGKEANGDPITKDVTISFVPIIPMRKFINADSGKVMIEVAFLDDKRKDIITHTMPLRDLLSSRGVHSIHELADYGLNIPDKKGGMLVDFLSLFLELNKRIIPVETVYDTMGWKENYNAFVIGNLKYYASGPPIPVRINSNLKAVEGFGVKGERLEWIKGTRKLLKYPNTRFSCYVTIASFALKVLEEKSRAFNRFSESSQGKSTVHDVAMSLHGCPELLNLTGSATTNGVEAILKVLNNCPGNFDDLQSATPEFQRQLAYLIANERGKARMKKDGDLKDIATWCCSILVSNEGAMLDENATVGARVRATDLYGGLPRDEEAFKDWELIKNKHYGHIAPLILPKIIAKKGELAEMHRKAIKELETTLPKYSQSRNIAGRMINSFAVVLVAGYFFEETMKELGEPAHDPVQIVKTIMEEAIGKVAEKPLAIRAIEHTYDWIRQNIRKFYINGLYSDEKHPPSEIYGNLRGTEFIDIYIKVFKEEMERANLNYTRIRDDWENMGLILKPDEFNSKPRIGGGKQQRAISIKIKVVEALTGEENPFNSINVLDLRDLSL